MGLLGIDVAHRDEVGGLPSHHGDPFDGMNIPQSLVEGIPVLGHDAVFAAHDVDLLAP